MKRWLLVGLVGLGGCSSFADDTAAKADAGSDAAAAVPEGGAGSSDAGSSDATASADAGCQPATATGVIVADTLLSQCGPDSNGGDATDELSGGPALFQFTFTVEDVDALTRATSLGPATFHLTAAGTVPAAAGPIEAHFARNDWYEGTTSNTSFDGANVCRRTATQEGAGWGTVTAWSGMDASFISSPADYDAVGPVVALTDGASDVTFTLDFGAAELQRLSTDLKASVLTQIQTRSSAHIVVAMREHATTVPTLAIAYCK